MPAMTQEQVEKLIEDIVGKQVTEALKEIRSDQKSYSAAMRAGIGDPVEATRKGEQDREKGLHVGAFVRALAAAKGDVERAAAYAKKNYDQDVPGYAAVTKALAAGDAQAGGFLIPEQFSTEVIEFIRPNTVVRAAGPRVLPMPEGNLSIPRINTGSVASYIGENANLPNTAQQFGMVKLSYKKLAALIPVSNDLLRYSSPEADGLIRDDVALAMAQAEDLNFLRSLGTQYSPKGLRYWAASGNVFGSAGTSTANMITDLSTAILKLKNANIKFVRPIWFMSPRTEQALLTATNSNGFYIFRAEMLQNKLWGMPYATTTQIPTNLGAGSDSEIYLTDMIHAVIGEAKTIIIDASTEAAYNDGSQVQAAFSLDQTVIRAIAEHDFVVRHDFAGAVVTGVDY